MYGFEHMLFENEKLVYSGRARPDLLPKEKDFGLVYVLVTLFLFMLVYFLIYDLFTAEEIEMGLFIAIPLIGLTIFVLVYNGIYTKFIKKKKIVDYEYGLTDLRILIYNKKTKKLIEAPIKEYINIYVLNNDFYCGDLVFSKSPNIKGLNDQEDGQAQPLLIGKQTHTLIFEAVEKPQDVKKLAIALRDRLNN